MRLAQALNWIEQQQAQSIEQLMIWCNVNSGSTHLAGIEAMYGLLHAAFAPISDQQKCLASPMIQHIGFTGEIESQKVGASLLCQKRPHLSRRILLCGHMDTIFPATSLFQLSSFEAPSRIRGPGVSDMKGGLLVMLLALQAFERTLESQHIGWDVFINADEEIGSLASQAHLMQLAKTAQVALVFEPTLNETGTIARARKGCGHFTLIASGKSAHAGRNFIAGKNAITLLAKAITAIDQLNSPDAAFTINIGQIQGGESVNQVPARAVAKIDIRITDPDTQTWLTEQLQQICHRLSSPDYAVSIEGAFHRPVKLIQPQTERLFARLKHSAKQIGLPCEWQDSGGASDGNNLSEQALALLDGLGVKGGNIHTENEYVVVESIAEQASLSLCLLHDLASEGWGEVFP